MNEFINLLSCPFCGGKAAPVYAKTEDGQITYSIVCSDCKTGIFRARIVGGNPEHDTFENIYDAVAAWNRRAEANA